MEHHRTIQVHTLMTDEDCQILENALQQLPGVQRVEAHYPSKHVTIAWQEPANWDDIYRRLDELGYGTLE